MTPPYPHSYWIEEGRILGGEYPRHYDDGEKQDKMSALLATGVRTFIDLTEEGELKPYREMALDQAKSSGIDPNSLTFHRFPILDYSVPRSPKVMADALRALRLARHCGEVAYLHCWGGRGRTGTVAACFLRDFLALEGEEALALLSQKWQACAKSAYSESPETEEQRGYVRSWNPVSSRAERFRAALLGAVTGDALGVPVEFSRRSQRQADPVVGMRAFGTHHQPAGTWSDDTSMILATVSAMVEAGQFDPEIIMREFSLWLDSAKYTPYGSVYDARIATRTAIGHYDRGRPALECGDHEEIANGSGSIMRILPLALAYADHPDLISHASTLSSLTHAHERSRFCCAFYCLTISELLHHSSLEDSVQFAWSAMKARWNFSPAELKRFESLQPERLFTLSEEAIDTSGHVIDTLKAALWVNHQHDNYRDVVLHAVNLGGDTDTVGCLAGAIAGLLYGVDEIPEEWLSVLAKRNELETFFEQFASRFSSPSTPPNDLPSPMLGVHR